MLVAYFDQNNPEPQVITAENQALLKKALWIDLFSPTKEEESFVEKSVGLDVPTREDMIEIELSSRLYKDQDAYIMTAMMISTSDQSEYRLDPVTFVVTPTQLITIRYVDPQSFKFFIYHFLKGRPFHRDAPTLFVELMDATIDNLADTLELVGHRLDEYSRGIFRRQNKAKLDYHHLLQQISENGDLNSKACESLVALNRVLVFFGNSENTEADKSKLLLTTLSKDIVSLSDHANFLSTKINFLLEATLGMVNIEQNNIIKIFTVASVIFLPPTLVASIYGMNFRFMPELEWQFGYLFSVGLIIVAAWLPYKYFKYRKWL